MRINIVVKFKNRAKLADTDIQCAHNAINMITIEIDTTKYSDLKFYKYPYPFNSKEFISTIISSDLIEDIESIGTEVIMEDD